MGAKLHRNMPQTRECRRSSKSGRLTAPYPLPLIDIEPLYSRNCGHVVQAAAALGRAAHEHGFLYIKGHSIDDSAIVDAYTAAQQFFRQPLEFKNQYYIGNSSNHRGYVPVTEKGVYPDEEDRHYESYDLALDLPASDPDYVLGNPLLGPNVWPAIPKFKDAVYNYYLKLGQLGRLLTHAFEIHLGVPAGTFSRKMTKPVAQLRLLHYIERKNRFDQEGQNMGAHTDYECFTILHQDSPGLQVLDLADHWVNADPIEGTFLVNIGDMFELWSGGYLKATPHRVVNCGTERFSMPYFAAANYSAVIKPEPHAHSCPYQKNYHPMVAGHHMMERLIRDFSYIRKRYKPPGLDDSEDCPSTLSMFEERLHDVV